MDKDSFNLSSKDILEKEFKIDTRGFRIKEVDAFLDEIIEDYEHYDKVIRDLETEKGELQDEILSLKQEIRNLKTSIEIAKTEGELARILAKPLHFANLIAKNRVILAIFQQLLYEAITPCRTGINVSP